MGRDRAGDGPFARRVVGRASDEWNIETKVGRGGVPVEVERGGCPARFLSRVVVNELTVRRQAQESFASASLTSAGEGFNSAMSPTRSVGTK